MDTKTLNTVRVEEDRLICWDFEVPGINGVFRAHASNIHKEVITNHVEKALNFIQHYLSEEFNWEDVQAYRHLSNGWEWYEAIHPRLPEYSLSSSTSWFTVKGSNSLVETMYSLYQIKSEGLKIELVRPNKQPDFLFYFFPYSNQKVS